MAIVFIILIVLGAFFILLFLYSLLKVAHISDVSAGYDEGRLTQEDTQEHIVS